MKKQPNSRHCFLCGLQNPRGLHLSFYEDAEGRVVARYTPDEAYQGFPGVLHGGIISALLDEAIGRTLISRGIWAMTVDLHVRFQKPVPLGEPLTVIGEMTGLRSRTMEGKGEIRLADGTLAATAEAKYIRLSEDEVDQHREEIIYWRVAPDDDGD